MTARITPVLALCLAGLVGAPTASAHPAVPRAAAQPATGVDAAGGCGFSQDDPAQIYGSAIGSQDYESKFDVYDQEAADDFVCTNSTKRVKTIRIGGTYFAGIGPAQGVDVVIRSNDRSGDVDEPSDGDPVCSFSMTSRVNASAEFVVRPEGTPCHLKAGRKYWLQVRARMDFETAGSWGWLVTEQNFGADPDWRNPGDGFATGCTTYSGSSDPGSEGGDRTATSCAGGTVPPGMGVVFSVD
jgi:hypothetical protein